MTLFMDGPAADVPLALKRAPVMLRVVRGPGGKWDALDQPDDVARPNETIYVYRLMMKPIVAFIRGRGGINGRWPIARYQLLQPQPLMVDLHDNKAWAEWCDANREALMPEWAKGEEVSQ